MTLLNSEILWNLLWLLPLCAVLFYISYRKRNRLLERFLGKHAKDPAYVSASPVLRFWRAVILTAVIVLLLIAAARPSWGHSILPYTGQGRDLMFIFDVSKSMLAQDVKPSRLEHAKWLVRQLAERNPGDRFGLIAFAGNAFLECPLTIDKTSFLASVNELSTDSIPLGGTNIQKALSESIRGFRAAESQFRAVVLITDGDELTGDSGKAVQEIIRLRIPLFIFGIGDPSQPSIIQLPDGNGGIRTLKDKDGNVVNAPLNEKKLAKLAAETGGIYVRSTTTNPGIEPVETRIKKLDTREIDSGKQTRPIERPLYPLLAAFLLFLLWLVIPEKRRKIKRMNILLAGFLFLSMDSFAQAPVPEKKGKDEIQTQGLSPEEIYNLGLKAQTQEKNPQKAVKLYSEAIDAVDADPEVRGRSAQNLGVMNHQMARAMLQQTVQTLQAQQLDQSLQLTEKALKQLDKTEEIYKSSLKVSSDTSAGSRNQHQLLVDRKKTEELKKKIEELKKKQQEARQNTQKAMDQQKKQDKQDQKQNQKSAKDQTQKARESAKQMEKQAKELNQKQMEDQAKKAGEELEKAQKAQEKTQNKKAEEHLKKALQHLGSDQKQDQKQNQQNKDGQKQDQNNKENQKKDKQLPKQQPQQAQQAQQQPEKEIDKNQAKALLEMMAGDEKKLKDELKARMKRNYDSQSVEKDW